MNKKQYFSKIKYYAIALAISLLPLIGVNVLLADKVKEGVLWVITIVICLAALFTALLIEPKMAARKEKKKQEKKKNNNFDPYAD